MNIAHTGITTQYAGKRRRTSHLGPPRYTSGLALPTLVQLLEIAAFLSVAK